ncbi:MAG: PAS domain S-box protein [Rhodospirillales bacterium]|nr:PAS domain S-box protein [Rhodospirillales bacterium]
MFKFLRYFSIASAVAFIGMTVILLFIYRQLGLEQVANEVERANVTMSRAFANSIWPQFSQYVMVKAPTTGAELLAHSETMRIHQAVKKLTAELNVIKVKIYRLNGLTVYSSEFSQIGHDKSNNLEFAQSARSGVPASKFGHRDTFNGINGPLRDRYVVESYLPVRGKSGKVVAIFELYSDVTKNVDVVFSDVKWLSGGLFWAFGILYGVLFLIARRADNIIKVQEKSLRRSEGRLRGAIDSLQEGFALYDADDRLIAFNKIYEQIRPGLKEIMERGGTFEDVIRGVVSGDTFPEAKGSEEEFIQERLERHRNPKGPIIRKFLDGGWHRIEEARTPEGGIALSVIDITELKQAEEKLRKAHDGLEDRVEQRTSELRQEVVEREKAEVTIRESEKRFRDLTDGSVMGVVIDRRGKPLFVNQAYANIFGYDHPDEILAFKKLDTLYAADDLPRIKRYRIDRLEGREAPEWYEFQGIRKDGSPIWLEGRFRVVSWEDKPATQSTLIEITERKQAETELIHHKKMESLGSLAGGIAHNINNLLQPILMLSKLTQKNFPKESREYENMAVINEACLRAKGLVDQIAAFSRSEELVKKNINIYETILEWLDLIHSIVPSSITVSEELDKDTGFIVADPTQTQTVLVNLIANAVYAMRGGAVS